MAGTDKEYIDWEAIKEERESRMNAEELYRLGIEALELGHYEPAFRLFSRC